MSVTKDKERGSWYFTGYYRDAADVRRHYCRRGFQTKREAKEAEHAFLVGVKLASPALTLDDLFEQYVVDFHTMGLKEATLINTEDYYHSLIQKDLGKVRLSKLTAPVIIRWVSGISAREYRGKPYAVGTINKARKVLSKLLSYAVQLGYLQFNPCTNVPAYKRPEAIEEAPSNFWEPRTYDRFMEFVDDQHWRDVFAFLWGTGVREGELFALRWSDVDLGAGTVRINKSLTYKTKSKGWALTSPKTANSIRTIDLQDSLLNALQDRYARESCKDEFNSDYFVFGDLTPISAPALRYQLNKYIKRSGVKHITPHGFRHSHASYLIRSGKLDDQLIADRLGHTVAVLRKTYAHIYDEARADLKSILNEIY